MMENNGAERTGLTVRGVAGKVNNSVSLLLAIAGFLLIVVSGIIREGAVPALMTIWGVGLIVLGLGAYTTLWWLKR